MVDTPITSETLQQSYRNSFPSQIGAQRDLHVSDVIIPIVDLTPASEGSASNLSQALQEAIDYSSTVFAVSNTTTTIITTTGFWRIRGTAAYDAYIGSPPGAAQFILNDSTTDKVIFDYLPQETGTYALGVVNFDFIVYLRSGDSVKVTTSGTYAHIVGNARQVADISGTLQNPNGFV